MSTRAMVDFVNSFKRSEIKDPSEIPPEGMSVQHDGDRIVIVRARIYRHSDGYPEGLGADLLEFFSEVERQTKDTRFGDASYLAAKYVVWQAAQYARGPNPLDFLSLGIDMAYHSDIEYVYRVDCSQHDANRPAVTVAEFGFGKNKPGKFKPLPKNVVAAGLARVQRMKGLMGPV